MKTTLGLPVYFLLIERKRFRDRERTRVWPVGESSFFSTVARPAGSSGRSGPSAYSELFVSVSLAVLIEYLHGTLGARALLWGVLSVEVPALPFYVF